MERTQEQWKLLLPQEFWMPAMPRPKCYTVGELKEQLARLPDDLPVSAVGDAGLSLYIYSVDTMDEEDCQPELVIEGSTDVDADIEDDSIVDFWDDSDEDYMEDSLLDALEDDDEDEDDDWDDDEDDEDDDW